jgi:RimJ/RimL family protein N-acetyltransferase
MGSIWEGERVRLRGIEPGDWEAFMSDRRAGTFGYGLGIGRPHQRRGYATEAIVLLLRCMFGEPRYQKCDVGVYAYDTASLALHRKLGFVEEGRRRRAQFMAGRYHDEVLLGLTVEEFTADHPLPGVGG